MKYPKLLSEELMLITPGGYTRLAENYQTRAQWDGGDNDSDEEGEPYVDDGIMHIAIHGPIGQGLTDWEKECGACDVGDIQCALNEAGKNYGIRGVILDFDTPGGMVNGTPECADCIAEFDKPIYAYSGGMIASAGYWLAAACDGIFTTKSADTGSIGVYIPFQDMSELAKNLGIKVQVFSSGKYKGMGVPGTSLTPDQENLLHERVQEIAEMFYGHVRSNRPGVSDDDMQGQVFKASQAASHGLIDAVVRSKQDVIDLLR